MTSPPHGRGAHARARRAAPLALAATLAVLVSACSSGSTETDTTPTASPSGSPDAAAVEAFQACLAEQGVELRGPAGSAPPQLPDGVDPDALEEAFEACSDIAPGLTPPGGGAVDDSAVAAFASCLEDNGVRIEGSDLAAIGALDQDDPDVAEAFETCAPLLPSLPAPAAS